MHQNETAPGICTTMHAVGYEIGLPCTKTMPAPAICTTAHAVGHEIDLSCGESRRDMVFYAAASEVAHGKKKPASQKTPASMICSTAHAVVHEISLSWGESRRDMVFYGAASGVSHGKKKAGIPKDTSLYDLFRSTCCRIRNWFAMHQMIPAPAICSAAHAVGYEIGLPCIK